MKQSGVNIVNFGVGEPDFDTPEFIRNAAITSIREGQTRYTAVGGVDQLKDAICRTIEAEYGISYERENVLVSCGGKHALYNLFQALLDPGDEVIIPSPYWVSYPDMVELADATPVIVPCLEGNGFRLTPGGSRESDHSENTSFHPEQSIQSNRKILRNGAPQGTCRGTFEA